MDSGSLEYNVICVKWGDKFSPEHVNRLYRMAKKNISLPFNFYCWTEDATGIYDDVKIIPLDQTLDLEAWWWKLTLFKENELNGVSLFLDLDVVIQNNIDHLFDIAEHNKLTLIDRSIFGKIDIEKPTYCYDQMTQAMYNSSIMIWYANENQDLYNKFIENIPYYISIYSGIDRFFTYEIPPSKFKDVEVKNYYFRKEYFTDVFYYEEDQKFSIKIKRPDRSEGGSQSRRVFFDKNKPICVFNGCHEDYFYKGMEGFLL
jgi:hypothetical protein